MQTVYIYTKIYGANGICFGIRPEMTDFGWYTTGIWCPGICITNFFFAGIYHKILSYYFLTHPLAVRKPLIFLS